MIGMSSILSRYIGRQFMTSFAGMMVVLLGVMSLFDTIEILRRANDMPQISFKIVLSLTLLKMPYLCVSILPMGILFSAIHTCWKLNKTSELIVIRSTGISAWQFLSPILACALLIGVLSTTILSPASSVFLGKYDRLNSIYFSNNANLLTVSKTGIWLRQPSEQGYALLHSENFDKKAWQLNAVTVLFFDNADNFIRRVDSPITYLKEGHWDIRRPVINGRGETQYAEALDLPTGLTVEKIEDSFADPETISFWSIPESIRIMEETGFPATRLYLYFHKLLAQPFLFISMVLLAATFSLRPPRFGGVFYMVGLGVLTGLFVFFIDSILHAFGVSQKIPPYLAAWSPALITLLLGSTALLHKEDG